MQSLFDLSPILSLEWVIDVVDSNLKLYIDSGTHITNPSKRIKRIENAVDDLDVVFVEQPFSGDHTILDVVRNFLFLPFLLSTMYVWRLILTVVGEVFKSDDTVVINHLLEKYEAERVSVDLDVQQTLGHDLRFWFIGHALVVLLGFVALPVFLGQVFPYLPRWAGILTVIIIVSLTTLTFFLAGINQARELQMARDIIAFAESSTDTTACLIIGSHHEAGVVELVREDPTVEIIEGDSTGEKRE